MFFHGFGLFVCFRYNYYKKLESLELIFSVVSSFNLFSKENIFVNFFYLILSNKLVNIMASSSVIFSKKDRFLLLSMADNNFNPASLILT